MSSQHRKRLTIALAVSLTCVVLFTGLIPIQKIGIHGIKNLYPSHGLKAIAKEPSRGLLAYEDRQPTRGQTTSTSKIFTDPKIKEFLSWKLTEHSNETDVLARHLTTTYEVISEAQRILINLCTELFGTYKYAFLFDMANFENKGDPAINMGELYLLRYMNVEVLYNCHYSNCTDKGFAKAKKIADQFSKNDVIILCSGGGNMGGYPINDHLRYKVFKHFPDHKIIVFPQSTWFHDPKHFTFAQKVYSSHKDLTILLRDRVSLEFVRKNFPKPKTYLSPDVALFTGHVERFMPPVYDIIWLRRSDGESTQYKLPPLPQNLSMMISDWWLFKTPVGKNVMENTFLYTTTGFMFIQRGRVLITDRLHGHILAVLLNIPHVIIDNKIKKISNFRNSWTAGLEIVRVATDPADAISKAIELIKQFDQKLPTQVAYMRSQS